MREIVATLLLAAHLLAMNLAAAGPLVGAWLLCGGGPQDESLRRTGRRVVWQSLGALVVGSLLGGGLLLLPNAALRAALGRFPADAYWFAGIELLFSAACIGAMFAGARMRRHRMMVGGLAFVSATNLLYHFPPLMAVIGELAADPRWAADERINRTALLRLWGRPEILALWTHFILASLAVAPIAAMWTLKRRDSQAAGATEQSILRRLAAWALAATVLQIPAGLWLLASSDAAVRESMMGENVVASLCFTGGVLAALWLLQTLTAITLGEDNRGVRRAGYLLVTVTILMSASLRASRTPTSARIPAATRSSPLPAPSWTLPSLRPEVCSL